MKNLIQVLSESILGDIDSTVEEYVEIANKMAKDLAWIKRLKLNDAVHFEAALFNVTYGAFGTALKMTNDERRVLAALMSTAISPYICYNWEDIEDWEEREYAEEGLSMRSDQIDALGMMQADVNDSRWKAQGSNSFYHYFWDADYIHSLDQEDLLKHLNTQKYTKQLIKVVDKYGLKLKPIF